jgi:hypothetical protein
LLQCRLDIEKRPLKRAWTTCASLHCEAEVTFARLLKRLQVVCPHYRSIAVPAESCSFSNGFSMLMNERGRAVVFFEADVDRMKPGLTPAKCDDHKAMKRYAGQRRRPSQSSSRITTEIQDDDADANAAPVRTQMVCSFHQRLKLVAFFSIFSFSYL